MPLEESHGMPRVSGRKMQHGPDNRGGTGKADSQPFKPCRDLYTVLGDVSCSDQRSEIFSRTAFQSQGYFC